MAIKIIAAKECFIATVKSKTKPEKVQWIEVPKQEMLDHVGKKSTEKVVDLVQHQIDDDSHLSTRLFPCRTREISADGVFDVQH